MNTNLYITKIFTKKDSAVKPFQHHAYFDFIFNSKVDQI